MAVVNLRIRHLADAAAPGSGRGAQPQGGAGKTSLIKDLRFALSELGVEVLQVGLDPPVLARGARRTRSDTPPERTVSPLLMWSTCLPPDP
jgi:hypothetical protein